MEFFASKQLIQPVTSDSPLGCCPSALSCCVQLLLARGCCCRGILSLPSRLGDSGSSKRLSAGAPSLIPSLCLSHGLGWGLRSDEQVGSPRTYWTGRTEHSWDRPLPGPKRRQKSCGWPWACSGSSRLGALTRPGASVLLNAAAVCTS